MTYDQLQPTAPTGGGDATPPGYRDASGLAQASLLVGGLLTFWLIAFAVVLWVPSPPLWVDVAGGLVGLAVMVTLVAAAVLGLVWLHRVRLNAEALSHYPHARRRVWVILAWFTPVVFLWFPYQVVRDVRQATSGIGGSAVVEWWWAAFLVTAVLQRFQSRSSLDNALPDTLLAAAAVVCFALWVHVVRSVQQSQQRVALRLPH